MSLIGAKFLQKEGWILLKNRDQNIKPNIRIRKSQRKNIERLYLWDDLTSFTEGINEFGVAIISAISNDDIQIAKDNLKKRKGELSTNIKKFYSPDGLSIRKALFEKSARKAVKKLVEFSVVGTIIVADFNECFVLESTLENNNYSYDINQIPNGTVVVKSTDEINEKSQKKIKKLVKLLNFAKDFESVLDVFSTKNNIDSELNPLIFSKVKNAIKTTAQIILCPLEKTLHFRPIWANSVYNIEMLNTIEGKTFFELVSTRKLISFREKI